MKYLLFFTIIFLVSCNSYNKSLSERKGLMLLKTDELPRNKKMLEAKTYKQKKRIIKHEYGY